MEKMQLGSMGVSKQPAQKVRVGGDEMGTG